MRREERATVMKVVFMRAGEVFNVTVTVTDIAHCQSDSRLITIAQYHSQSRFKSAFIDFISYKINLDYSPPFPQISVTPLALPALHFVSNWPLIELNIRSKAEG